MFEMIGSQSIIMNDDTTTVTVSNCKDAMLMLIKCRSITIVCRLVDDIDIIETL